MKKEQAEENYPEKVADRDQKRFGVAAHTNPLVFETSESEGIPESLSMYIPECVGSECDVCTVNMFNFRFWLVSGASARPVTCGRVRRTGVDKEKTNCECNPGCDRSPNGVVTCGPMN